MDATRTFPVTSEYNRLEAAYEGRHRRFPAYAYYWHFSPHHSAYATCGDVASISPDTDPWELSWKWFKPPIGQYIKLRTPDGRTLTTGYTSDKGKPIVPTGDPFVYCLMKDQPWAWAETKEILRDWFKGIKRAGSKPSFMLAAEFTYRPLAWTVSHAPEVMGDSAVMYTIWVDVATRFATNSHKEWKWYANEYRKPPRPCVRGGMYDSAYKKHDFKPVPRNDGPKNYVTISVDATSLPALLLVAQERERQMAQEGWTTDHDDEHNGGELARAAAAYIIPNGLFGRSPNLWPWDSVFFKPAADPSNKAHRIRELVKGAALACAEIDRLLRMEGNTL